LQEEESAFAAVPETLFVAQRRWSRSTELVGANQPQVSARASGDQTAVGIVVARP
jgi:hypothetical protein